MDRRRFLKSAALGGSVSAFFGLTPLNPLIKRTRNPPETQSPESTLPEREPTSEPETPTESAAPAYRMWETEFRGDIYGLTTSEDAKELYLAISNKISRLDADTGELEWQAESEQSISQPVVLSEEKTIATGRDGRVLAVNRQNGNRDWFENTGWFLPSRPAVYENTAVIVGDSVRGYDISSGTVQWDTEGSFTNANILEDGRFLYVGSAWDFGKYDMTNGSTVWRWGNRERGRAPSKNYIIDHTRNQLFGNYNQQLFAIDTREGDKVWMYEAENVIRSIQLQSDRMILLSETDAGNTLLSALRVDDQREIWKQIAPLDIAGWDYGKITTYLSSYESRIIAGTSTGHLVELEPETGSLSAATDISESRVYGMLIDGTTAITVSEETISGIDLEEL